MIFIRKCCLLNKDLSDPEILKVENDLIFLIQQDNATDHGFRYVKTARKYDVYEKFSLRFIIDLID